MAIHANKIAQFNREDLRKQFETLKELGLDAATFSEDLEKTKQVSGTTTPLGAPEKREQADNIPDPYLIGWEEDDSDLPRTWSFRKRAFVAFSICLLTFSVYVGSAIYTASIPGLMEEFHVSLIMPALELTLYVLAYGIGGFFFDTLARGCSARPESGLHGDSIVLQIPIVTAQNISTVLTIRFLTGLIGSPALASGAAG
ncbi:hypothetical protein B0H19DRAFT_1251120 [Mycena capillaripes]|nr:hypothetical protein B0H19DRAFT_1251120 [Mycena capillaripes]